MFLAELVGQPGLDTMEELQKRHRQEQKDLQAVVMQKKKNASKKTRKGVLDECGGLEQALKKRQELESSELLGNAELPSEYSTNEGVQQLDANCKTENVVIDQESTSESMGISQPLRKRNRQKERLARRTAEQEQATDQAEEEASNQTDYRAKEREKMELEFAARGLIEQEIRSDGHCLYAAIADQLKQNGITIATDLPDYKVIRRDTALFIQSHADDFIPFLEEPLDEYIVKIRDTAEWGGQLELMAITKVYGITINVLQGDGQVIRIEAEESTRKEAWLAYYRHSFGLGEHYNSLRKKP